MQLHNSNSSDRTPKSSGSHLGIYIAMWMAYAPQQGNCDVVPLLCGGPAVQGKSPYTLHHPVHGLFCYSVNLDLGRKLYWVLNAICWLTLPIAKSLSKRTPRRVSLYLQVLHEGPALRHCKSGAGLYAATGYDICM